jgi:hypothetical protein
MKRVAILLAVGALIGVGTVACHAQSCGGEVFQSRVTVQPGPLTLADLLAPAACPLLREPAEKIKLGAAPQAGAVRILRRNQMRTLLDELAAGAENLAGVLNRQVPERMEIRLAGEMKSCADIAGMIARDSSAAAKMAAAPLNPASRDDASAPPGQLDCSSLHEVPRKAQLELLHTAWNAGLHRWEFVVRCHRAEECVPFLVSTEGQPLREPPAEGAIKDYRSEASRPEAAERIRVGEGATLVWEQSGLRVILPVVCLEAGEVGQSIRVRVRNGNRTLRAQVVGAGRVRVAL